MEEQIVSFGTSKLAKEKGCDIKGNYIYIGDRDVDLIQNYGTINKDYWQAPTQSIIQKWLREVHSIDVLVDKGFLSNKYSYEIYHKNDMFDSEYIFKTYEEALEKGLYETLKLI